MIGEGGGAVSVDPVAAGRWSQQRVAAVQAGAGAGVVTRQHHPHRAGRTDASSTMGRPPSSLETACAPRSSALAACTWLLVTHPRLVVADISGREALVRQHMRHRGGQPVDIGVVDHLGDGFARRVSQFLGLALVLVVQQAATHSCTCRGSTRTTLCMPSSLQPSSSRTGMVAKATLPAASFCSCSTKSMTSQPSESTTERWTACLQPVQRGRAGQRLAGDDLVGQRRHHRLPAHHPIQVAAG